MARIAGEDPAQRPHEAVEDRIGAFRRVGLGVWIGRREACVIAAHDLILAGAQILQIDVANESAGLCHGLDRETGELRKTSVERTGFEPEAIAGAKRIGTKLQIRFCQIHWIAVVVCPRGGIEME